MYPVQLWLLAASRLLRVAVDVGLQQRLRVECPVRDAIAAPGHVKLGDPPEVLDADEENRLPVDPHGAGIEDGVRRIRDVGGGEDRVCWMPLEETLRRCHRVEDRTGLSAHECW